MTSATFTAQTGGRNLNREDSHPNPTSQFRATSPLSARAKTGAIFVKRIGLLPYDQIPSYWTTAKPSWRKFYFGHEIKVGDVRQIRSRRNPARPPDEKYIFVKKGSPSEPMLRFRRLGSEQTAVGGAFNFRQEYFCWATVFPIRCTLRRASPHLEFSYRTIPLRRIRFACRLTAGAKFGRYFRQEMRKPVTPEASQAKKTGRLSWRKSLRC